MEATNYSCTNQSDGDCGNGQKWMLLEYVLEVEATTLVTDAGVRVPHTAPGPQERRECAG